MNLLKIKSFCYSEQTNSQAQTAQSSKRAQTKPMLKIAIYPKSLQKFLDFEVAPLQLQISKSTNTKDKLKIIEQILQKIQDSDFEIELQEQIEEMKQLQFNLFEDCLFYNAGQKLTIKQQIQIVVSDIWDQFEKIIAQKCKIQELQSFRKARGFEELNANLIQKVNPKDDQIFKCWKTYINLCQRKQDLYDFAKEYGFGSFNFKFVESIANFYKNEGDYFDDNSQPTVDYREADHVYQTSISNISSLISELINMQNTEFELLENENIMDIQNLQIFKNIIQNEIGHFSSEKLKIKEAYQKFTSDMEERLYQLKPRFQFCSKLLKQGKKRSFIESQKIIAEHTKIYSQRERKNGSQSIILGKGKSKYNMHVDDDCVENVIPAGSRIVERFYEALDELDQYDTSEFEKQPMGSDNFFVKELKQHNLRLKESRQGLKKSWLQRQPWLIINPKMISSEHKFEFGKQKAPSKKRKSRDLVKKKLQNRQIKQEFDDLLTNLDESPALKFHGRSSISQISSQSTVASNQKPSSKFHQNRKLSQIKEESQTKEDHSLSIISSSQQSLNIEQKQTENDNLQTKGSKNYQYEPLIGGSSCRQVEQNSSRVSSKLENYMEESLLVLEFE